MKFIKISRNLKIQPLMKLHNNEIISNLLASIGILALAAEIIWLIGPHLKWGMTYPLAQPEKRMYIILSLFLVWLLKLLIVDLDSSNGSESKESQSHKKRKDLQSRFQGAVQFLKKTTISRHDKAFNLSHLPWYLLIGPTGSGKTALLAYSNVHFILQKQFQPQDLLDIAASENCDWWVTRDACIVDVPGKYLSSAEAGIQPSRRSNIYSQLWQFFLQLIKKQRGKTGLSGIIIALPLPEILESFAAKSYQASLRDIFQRIHEMRKIFPHNIPCQIILTKCDLLPGFTEFFSESSSEEIAQAWGITFSSPQQGEKAVELFVKKFNALIKKLNEQLIWRLHQERNPMARPYIKDFPLQLEHVKECLADFIKKLAAAQLGLSIQGVYLTSAMQPKPEPDDEILEQSSDNTSRAVQIFKEPALASRAYFIKQFFTHGVGHTYAEHAPVTRTTPWKYRIAYALSASFIIFSTFMLGKDFNQGINQAYAIENNLSDFQLRIAHIQDPDEHLKQAIHFLNTLQQSINKNMLKFDLSHLLSFYTYKFQQKTSEVYQEGIRTILIPEMKNYFEYYLQNPVNKNADDIYAVLKAYIEMGDASHFDAKYITSTMIKILPKTLQENDRSDLIAHMTAALNESWNPVIYNAKIIEETRKFLFSLPSLKLSYVILKNIDKNNTETDINIGSTSSKSPFFSSQQTITRIPVMFTAKAFSSIVTQDAATAAQEATSGNWILGNELEQSRDSSLAAPLIEQLRTAYVNNYVEAWENLLSNIRLSKSDSLAQTDNIIIHLISNESPLIQFLKTLHDNTYFEPIASSSQKLQSLATLLEKNNQAQNQLYEILTSLQTLHQYLQTVLNANNQKKAAFEVISSRMLSRGTPDAITQLRLVADKNPEPVKSWLENIANDSWRYLMQEAGHYIDTSWQTQVIHSYQADIANHYPFSTNSDREVDIQKFITFFGNNGKVTRFYSAYLHPLVDTSNPEWHWKKIDDQQLPLSENTLRQIQQAMRINSSFFSKGDNKLYVQFSLQPYKFGKQVKRIKLSINNNQFMDDNKSMKNQHVISWPNSDDLKMTTISLTMANKETITRHYPGNWGWFKLVSQSFESMVSRKEILINLSLNEHPAKYLLSTEGKFNPFLSLNMRHFHLPQQITDEATYK